MAASREALLGLSNGLRAFQEGMNQLGQASVAFGVACKSVAIEAYAASKSIASISKKFTTDTTRAYYNIAGQYTFPIEQELVGSAPPAPSDLNAAGRIAISLPIILPTMLLSVTAIPLIGNSLQSIPRGFVDVTNLALADLNEEEQLRYPPEQRNMARKIYGGLGYLLGGAIGGIPAALTVGTVRIIDNSCNSIPESFIPLVNLTLPNDYALSNEPEPRTNTAWVLGVPGLALGAIAGVIGMIGVVIGRIFINSVLSLNYYFKHSLNFALPYNVNYQFLIPPDTRPIPSFLFGLPGVILGFTLGGFSALCATSTITMTRVFVAFLNTKLPNGNQIKLATDSRGLVAKIVGFIPGVIIGAVLGKIASLVILLARFVINTVKSFAYYFQQGLSLGLPSPLVIAEENREAGSIRLGYLGAASGAVFGFLTGCIASTAISAVGSFVAVSNVALHKDDQIKLDPDQRTLLGQFMGGIGWVIGGLTGVFSALAVFLSRVVINSAISWLYGFKYSLNCGLPEAARLANPENRDANTKSLGLPGLVIGGCLGIISGFFASTAITTAGVWMIITNKVLEQPFILGDDTRSGFGKILGGLGIILGGITGLLCAMVIRGTQIYRNSKFCFNHYFRSAINLSLPEGQKLTLAEDTRNILRFFPSGLSGAAFGMTVAFCISSALTTVNAFKTVTNLALENQLAVSDTRGTTGKILGGLGWILGGITGLLGAFGVICLRLLRHSAISLLQFFKLGLNTGLPADYHLKTEDNRSLINQSLGFPGLLLGSIFGGISAILASSAITTARTFVLITNLVLDENNDIKLSSDKRSSFGKVISVLGLIPGTVAGIIGAFFAGFTRIIINTGVSALNYMQITSNYGLPSDQQFGIENDTRNTSSKVLGALGIPLGCLIGGIGALFISSLQTLGRTFIATVNYPWDLMRITLSPDLRSGIGIGLGILGIPFGLTFGLLGALIPVAGRLCYEGDIVGGKCFEYLVNFALHPDDRLHFEFEDNFRASAFAIPGAVLGSMLGIVGAVLVSVARFISQNCKSWFYLSGSLLNCGVGWRLCDGLSIDRRSIMAKTVGGLGYVFATLTTLPLATLIFTVRKLPLIISVALGFLCSPMILVYRGCANAIKYFSKDDQFEPPQQGELNIVDHKSVIQGFKNIFSSLNAWGSFSPNNYLAHDADGTKSGWTFFRKCVTFNTRSVAERTLNDLLVAYKEYAKHSEGSFGPEFFDSPEFDRVIENTKDYYANGCFDSRKEIANLHIEITNIATFVKSYMKDRINDPRVVIPEVAVPEELPFGLLFFGQRQVAPPGRQPGESPAAEGVPCSPQSLSA